jgi:probable HAF family extracellular repeat protein
VSQPTAINDAGVVVGGSYRPTDGLLVGFTWSRLDGMREVTPPQGIGGVMGIASDGSVSGWYNPAPAGFPTSRGFFRRPNAAAVNIGTLGGDQTQPAGMNARGEVVGWSHTSAGVRHAFVWSESGGMTDLGAEFELPSRAAAASGGVVAGTVNVTADPPPFPQRGINERPVIWIIRRAR